jgi:hypothetical protein
MFELVGNVTLAVFACLLIYLFFKRKRQFPIVFIGLVVANILVNAVDVLFSQFLPGTPLSLSWKVWLPGVLWAWYMLRSRRVRNTFVN